MVLKVDLIEQLAQVTNEKDHLKLHVAALEKQLAELKQQKYELTDDMVSRLHYCGYAWGSLELTRDYFEGVWDTAYNLK